VQGKREKEISMTVLLLGVIMYCGALTACEEQPLLPIQLSPEQISCYQRQEGFLWAAGAACAITEIAAAMVNDGPSFDTCYGQYIRSAAWATLITSAPTSLWNCYQGWRAFEDDNIRVNEMKSKWSYLRRAYGSLSINTASAALVMCNKPARIALLLFGGLASGAVDTVKPYMNLEWLRKLQTSSQGSSAV
jgi:hypothetical protein